MQPDELEGMNADQVSALQNGAPDPQTPQNPSTISNVEVMTNQELTLRMQILEIKYNRLVQHMVDATRNVEVQECLVNQK